MPRLSDRRPTLSMPDRFAHGMVLGKFYPLHAGHAHLIRTAQLRCDRVTVLLIGSSVESIPLEVRAEWLREDHPGVRLVAALDDTPVDFTSAAAWDAHTRTIARLLAGPVDAVFTSDAYGAELARRLDAAWVQVDADRTRHPVSGRAVRADPAGHWWALSAAVRAWFTQRVVVLGAESTGSTTLVMALAEHYAIGWVPEYGRTHSEIRTGGLSAPWLPEEFMLIADRQRALEQAAQRRAPKPLVICDTDVLATALWSERYVGLRNQAIFDLAAEHRPALYLLTGDEIPFVQDGMRDGEHLRHAMQQRFRAELAAQPVPWLEVHGSVSERLRLAVPAVDLAVAAALRHTDPLELQPTQPPPGNPDSS